MGHIGEGFDEGRVAVGDEKGVLRKDDTSSEEGEGFLVVEFSTLQCSLRQVLPPIKN